MLLISSSFMQDVQAADNHILHCIIYRGLTLNLYATAIWVDNARDESLVWSYLPFYPYDGEISPRLNSALTPCRITCKRSLFLHLQDLPLRLVFFHISRQKRFSSRCVITTEVSLFTFILRRYRIIVKRHLVIRQTLFIRCWKSTQIETSMVCY